MTSALFENSMSASGSREQRRRHPGAMSVAAVAVSALMLAGCGGGDDDATAGTSTTIAVTVAPVATTTPPVVAETSPPVTSAPDLITAGATLIVANASGINGAAARMSDALAIAGFDTAPATNSSEGQLITTKIYFDAEDPNAEAVANSVRLALGGGAIQVLEMATPAPVESGEVGGATIVVAMGNDVSDKTLEELQGLAPATTTTTTTEG